MTKKLFLLLLTLFSLHAFSQNKLGFGLNTLYSDSSLIGITHSVKPFTKIAGDYNIKFLRYPAGTESRTYIWDKPELIPQARKLYAQYLNTQMTGKEDKAKRNMKLSNDEQISNVEYGEFLKFCKRTNITPIIVLSIWYYHDDNTVYSIWSGSGAKNWDLILKNILRQASFTHGIISGPVYWEIGNEDNHIFSAADYALIAGKYATAIKAQYPDDKILINYSNPSTKKIDKNWNPDVLNSLKQQNAIKFIDFAAPHYYRAFSDNETEQKQLSSAEDVASRFTKVNVYSLEQQLADELKNYPNIHVFFTEYGLFKKTKDPNSNSQLEGLLMLYYLMQFNAGPKVDGIIRHGFTQAGSAFFFDDKNFKNLNYNFNPKTDDADFFKYIPPKAVAVKIFFENNPIKATRFDETKSYSYTLTTLPDKSCIINLLNFQSTPVTVNIKDILNNVGTEKLTLTTYKFTDLTNKQWNADKTSSVFTSSVQLPSYSYSVINTVK